MFQSRSHFGGPAFYGGNFGSSSGQTSATQSMPPDFMNCEVTPPGSTMISLHQKLDMLLDSNGKQEAVITELKKESSTLKEKLASVCEELQCLKENNATPVSSTKMKLPPVVSVCYCYQLAQYPVL